MPDFRSRLEASRRVTGVHALETLEAEGRYEAALVFGLPDELTEYVESERRELGMPCRKEDALVPHLTVVFVGRWSGSGLSIMAEHLRVLRGDVNVELGEIGVFKEGQLATNVHLSVTREEGLRSLHHEAMSVMRLAGWMPQTPYIGSRYHPHVTLVGPTAVPLSAAESVKHRRGRRTLWRLTELTLMGRKLHPVDPDAHGAR